MLLDAVFYFGILALMVAALAAALRLWDAEDSHDARTGGTAWWIGLADRVIHPRAHQRH